MSRSRWTRVRVLERSRAFAEWAAWLAHAPMSGLWLVAAALAVATGVEFFLAPKHALDLLAALGTVVGATEVTARFRGVAAWPTRSAYVALESAGDAALDDGEGDSLAQTDPTIGAVGAGRDTD